MVQPDTNIVNFSKKSPSSENISQRVAAQKLYARCEELTTNLLDTVVERMFENADDTLFKFAEKSEKSPDQNSFLDSLRIVRLRRDTIAKAYCEHIKQNFAAAIAPKKAANNSFADISLDQMALVNESDMEESVAIKNTITKIRYQYPEELAALQARLVHLFPDAGLNDDANPLGPESLCQSFLKASKTLEVSLSISLIILKLFENHIVNALQPLYQTVNQLLIDANVLPVIKPTINKPAISASSPIPRHTTAAPSMTPTENHSSAPATEASMSYLHTLMSQYRQVHAANSFHNIPQPGGFPLSGYAAAPMTEEAILRSRTALTSVLSTLQSNTAPAANIIPDASAGGIPFAIPAGELRQFVVSQLQTQGLDGRAINPIDNDIIDIVSMLFEYILDDDRVPDAAKAILGKLQIPMLKAAILDKEFFATKSHPARALLNDMARAAMAVADKDVEHATSLFGEIKRIVDIIISDFKDDIIVFTKVLVEFENFMELFRHHETMAQETVAKIIKHKEDYALASKWVDESLHEVLAAYPFPESIMDIITGPWKEVMLKTYLNGGQETDAWKSQVRFIEILNWSIQPKRVSMDRVKLAGIIYQLVGALRQGLKTIGVPDKEINQILQTLEPYHIASIKGLPHSTAGNLAPVPTPPSQTVAATSNLSVDDISGSIKQIETEIAALTKMEQASFLHSDIADEEILEDVILSSMESNTPAPRDQPQDEYLELARQLEQGNWVEFTGKRNQKIRAKLAFKSELLGEYTFLDWRHKVVADKTLYGLAADFRRGSAMVMDDVPILDRALTAVMQTLSGSAKA